MWMHTVGRAAVGSGGRDAAAAGGAAATGSSQTGIIGFAAGAGLDVTGIGDAADCIVFS